MSENSEKITLGIETSCDDTSIAIIKGDPLNFNARPQILAHLSASQEESLKEWEGVVPEIASRNHLSTITPLVSAAFEKAGLRSIREVDLIGVTTMPGLLGPLLVGINTAKTLSLFAEKPLICVNHVHAHIEAIHLTEQVSYPYLGLVVSGGHTLFILVYARDIFEIIGGTLDDAAGEAFDKGAKILGLPQPGGQIIDKMAKEGDKTFVKFPIGLQSSGDCNLSYSGVKTSLRQYIEKNPESLEDSVSLSNICASYQISIVQAINLKLKFALKLAKENLGTSHSLPIVVGGGVAANSELRKILSENYSDVHFVAPKFCTDNGAMIANFALRNFDKSISFPDCLNIDAQGRIISKLGHRTA